MGHKGAELDPRWAVGYLGMGSEHPKPATHKIHVEFLTSQVLVALRAGGFEWPYGESPHEWNECPYSRGTSENTGAGRW